jgi:sugar lactone lactonase YvrE
MGSALDQLVLNGHPGIYVDRNSTLYISDTGNERVIKYYENATSGIVVAGGHGRGPSSNQLNTPYGIYVDEIYEIGAIYICDTFNHRIQKWIAGAMEGITVAFNDDQLHSPNSILLAPTSDQSIMMYISSFDHNQILKWIPYAEKAETVVAGSGIGVGTEPDQLFAPRGIKFDKNWNLFVADTGNNRIKNFLFNSSSCTK